jgi:hypothetical protein
LLETSIHIYKGSIRFVSGTKVAGKVAEQLGYIILNLYLEKYLEFAQSGLTQHIDLNMLMLSGCSLLALIAIRLFFVERMLMAIHQSSSMNQCSWQRCSSLFANVIGQYLSHVFQFFCRCSECSELFNALLCHAEAIISAWAQLCMARTTILLSDSKSRG